MKRLTLSAAALVAFLLPAVAHATLQVFPTRILMSDQHRIANVSLRHIGLKPGAYKITAVFYRQLPNGDMQLAEPTPADRSIMTMLRFSPRNPLLPPNVEQVIRVMFAGPKNLPEGEYRAHLHFEPTDESSAERVTASSDGGKTTMQLSAKVAVAVPVIYRQGNPHFEVQFQNLTFTRAGKAPRFAVDMISQGNAFPFGDLHVLFTPKGGQPQEIRLVTGIASYLPKRTVSYDLEAPAGMSLRDGTLRVELREPQDRGGKVLTAAETRI